LNINDEVIIYYQGKKYTYEVSAIKVVSPEATGFYTGASPISMVRMQYCGPPTGSLNSRTLVDAILIDSVSI
jgi:sortase (surface protein transpeptidase)